VAGKYQKQFCLPAEASAQAGILAFEIYLTFELWIFNFY